MVPEAPSDSAEHLALLGSHPSQPPAAAAAAAAAVYNIPETTSLVAGTASSPFKAPQQQQQHELQAGSLEGSGDLVVTSSLCPVVALGSWWCQAGQKVAVHLVVFAGKSGSVTLG